MVRAQLQQICDILQSLSHNICGDLLGLDQIEALLAQLEDLPEGVNDVDVGVGLHLHQSQIELIFADDGVRVEQIGAVCVPYLLFIQECEAALVVVVGGFLDGVSDEQHGHGSAVRAEGAKLSAQFSQTLDLGVKLLILLQFQLTPHAQRHGGDEVFLCDPATGGVLKLLELIGVDAGNLRGGLLVGFVSLLPALQKNVGNLLHGNAGGVQNAVGGRQTTIAQILQGFQRFADKFGIQVAAAHQICVVVSQNILNAALGPGSGVVESAVYITGIVDIDVKPDDGGIDQIPEQLSAAGFDGLHSLGAGAGGTAADPGGNGGGELKPVLGAGRGGDLTVTAPESPQMSAGLSLLGGVVICVFVTLNLGIIKQGDNAGYALHADAGADGAELQGDLVLLAVFCGSLCNLGAASGDGEMVRTLIALIGQEQVLGLGLQPVEQTLGAAQRVVQGGEAAGSDVGFFQISVKTGVGNLPQVGFQIVFQEAGHIHAVFNPLAALAQQGGQELADQIVQIQIGEHSLNHLADLRQGYGVPGEVVAADKIGVHNCFGVCVGNMLDFGQQFGHNPEEGGVQLGHMGDSGGDGAQLILVVVLVEVTQSIDFQVAGELSIPGCHKVIRLVLLSALDHLLPVFLFLIDGILQFVDPDVQVILLSLQIGNQVMDDQMVDPDGTLAEVGEVAVHLLVNLVGQVLFEGGNTAGDGLSGAGQRIVVTVQMHLLFVGSEDGTVVAAGHAGIGNAAENLGKPAFLGQGHAVCGGDSVLHGGLVVEQTVHTVEDKRGDILVDVVQGQGILSGAQSLVVVAALAMLDHGIVDDIVDIVVVGFHGVLSYAVSVGLTGDEGQHTLGGGSHCPLVIALCLQTVGILMADQMDMGEGGSIGIHFKDAGQVDLMELAADFGHAHHVFQLLQSGIAVGGDVILGGVGVLLVDVRHDQVAEDTAVTAGQLVELGTEDICHIQESAAAGTAGDAGQQENIDLGDGLAGGSGTVEFGKLVQQSPHGHEQAQTAGLTDAAGAGTAGAQIIPGLQIQPFHDVGVLGGVGSVVIGIHHCGHIRIDHFEDLGVGTGAAQGDHSAVAGLPGRLQRTVVGAVGIDTQVDNTLCGSPLVIVILTNPVDQAFCFPKHIAAAATQTDQNLQGVGFGGNSAQTKTGVMSLLNLQGLNLKFCVCT